MGYWARRNARRPDDGEPGRLYRTRAHGNRKCRESMLIRDDEGGTRAALGQPIVWSPCGVAARVPAPS